MPAAVDRRRRPTARAICRWWCHRSVYSLAMSNHISDSDSPAQPTGKVAGPKGSADSNRSATSSPVISSRRIRLRGLMRRVATVQSALSLVR